MSGPVGGVHKGVPAGGPHGGGHTAISPRQQLQTRAAEMLGVDPKTLAKPEALAGALKQLGIKPGGHEISANSLSNKHAVSVANHLLGKQIHDARGAATKLGIKGADKMPLPQLRQALLKETGPKAESLKGDSLKKIADAALGGMQNARTKGGVERVGDPKGAVSMNTKHMPPGMALGFGKHLGQINGRPPAAGVRLKH